MRFVVQVCIEDDTVDHGVEVIDVAEVERDVLTVATLGLSIEDAKTILAGVQDTVVAKQAAAGIDAVSRCCQCDRRFAQKDGRQVVMRTLYGTQRIESPRWWTCSCSGLQRHTFSPLAAILPARSTPELALVEARLAAHMSYEAAAGLLGELFPTGRRIHRNEICRTVARIADRLDGELDDDRHAYIDPHRELPDGVPDMPLVVYADGGYVHSSEQTSRRDGWFQAVCGTVTTYEGEVRRFGFVPNVDEHSRSRIHDTLVGQGMRPDQLVTFITDGADDLAGFTELMNHHAEYVLDWFHIAMRFTVLVNTLTNVGWAAETDAGVDPETLDGLVGQMRNDISRAKWFLWHGNLYRSLQSLEDAEVTLECCDPSRNQAKALKMLVELVGYLDRNAARVPNYAERYRVGEPISSATAEGAVNQIIAKRMVKKQQMRWTPHGAHRILQIRTRVLDHQLDTDIQRWHPTPMAA